MKKVFLVLLALFTAILVLNCSKEETENNTSLNSFELTPTEIKVFLRETTTLTISSGNGSYRINQSPESKEIVEISLANENQNVLVKALKSGTTTASITDILSKTEITISIQAIIPPSYYTLSEDKKTLVKWNDTQEESIDLSSDPILKEITSVGEGAFKGNQTLKTITLPEKITFLGKESFSGVSKLESITLPNSITSVGEGVFAGCTALKEVTLPKNDTFTAIPKRTFEDCKSLSTIQLPESIQEIGILAFADAGLTTINLPENLLEIKQQAFAGNSALTEITIPKNVTLISLAAFQETGLKTVKVEGTLPPTLNFGIDSQTQQPIEPFPSATLENIFVPESVTQTYRDKDGWHNYASIINKNGGFKHLVINPTEVTLFVDEVKQLDIVSGNDDYDLEREESTKEIAFIGITNNQKTLGIRGKKVGAFKATVIDRITREKVEISITVLNPFTLSPNQLTLSVGQTKEVIIDGNGAYEIPSNAHATLNLSGDKKKLIVKGIKEGDTQVVIKDKKANLSATLSIKVNAENVTSPTDTVKEFSLSESQLTLKIDEQKILTLQGNEDYEIGSSPIAQLTLSADKKTLTVKALKAGEATIKIKDKKANKELPLHITVLKAFTLSPTEVSVTTGGITIVSIEGNGDYEIPTNAHVTLTLSGDKKKLTVKGVLVGNTQVVIKDKKANQLASLDIKVTAPAPTIKEFSLSESQLSLKVNEEKTLTLQGNEDYEIGASQIAQLTLGGDKKTLTVKAIKAGEETIKIKDKKTNKELPLHITVLKAFTLSPSEVSVTTGGITMVTIEGNGDYEIPTNSHVTLTLSGDKKKLTVKGVLVGNTQVVIKDKKANQLASLDIKVTAPAPTIKEFSLSESQLSLKVNEEKTLTLQGNEDYEIGASQIAQLTLGGDKKTLTVKAIKAGEETIKIKDKKTNKELPLHITVLKAFTLSPTEVSVVIGEKATITIEGNGDYELPSETHVSLSLSSDKKKLTIVGLQAGTARINIKDKALDEIRSFAVTVLRPFSIDPNSIDIKVGETKSIAIEGSGRYQIGSSPLIDIINKTEHLITFKGKSVGNGSISIKDELANKNLNLTIKVTKALVPFSISPSTIRVKVGETKTVSITGNGKYSLSKNNSSYAELTLNEQAGTLTVKGIAKGEEKLYIRDLNSVTEENNGKKGGKDHDSEDNEEAKNYESRELTITVIPATVEKQYNLSWDKYSIDKWLDTDAQEVDMTQIDELKSIGMVGEAAFKGLTNLKKVILPNTIEVIDRDAFANCTALTSIKLGGNKLDEIGNNAFSGCTKLTRIDIPKNVSRIKGGAFDDCNALQTIILRHTEVAPFHQLGNLNATIYVPNDLVDQYKNDMDWEPYKNKIKSISELTSRKTKR